MRTADQRRARRGAARWRRATTSLLVCALLGLGAVGPAAAQTDGERESSWTILEYDSKGRVIGARSGSAEDGAPGSETPVEKQVESGELLIAEPPAGADATLRGLGFRILERSQLDALEIEMWRVETPEGVALPEALRRAREALPDSLIDTNDLLDLSSGRGVQAARPQLAQGAQDFARDTVGWGVVPDTCGAGVKLGQIDGAVDVGHPALADRDVIYKSLIKQDREPAAEDHGTAIAVLMVGKPRPGRSGGLLPGATLYAANIFETWGGRARGNLAAMIRAVDWLVSNGVQVANFSVAGGENVLMRLAVARASAKGLIIVAAAGNKGAGAQAAWPAADPKSLAVTAIDRGLGLYRFANRGGYIDFAAPGVDLVTETPRGLREQSGTSMATPFITAVVALHLQAGFPADPDRIRESMKRYVHDLGDKGRDPEYGWGLVRIRPQCG
ncbi:MAG: S8 family serine peptidase [Marivibrio sp.]|uniref:S8 family serine peptidase n=1 Tax=Marivibrio sp. TaxID=2039719 RepID=UPI0032EB4BBC